MKTNLSVNINKIATLRNARGEDRPSVLRAAEDCQRFGADGITVHPRPDERHIRRSDVLRLRPVVCKEFNIEGHPTPEFMELVLRVKPEQVTLVPDAPDALTSNAGWDVDAHFDAPSAIAGRLTGGGVRGSSLVDRDPAAVRAAAGGGEGAGGVVGVESRCSGAEAAVGVEEAHAKVEGVASHVAVGDGVVVWLVVVVVRGYVDFRSSELFVEHSRLHSYREVASSQFDVIAQLQSHVAIVVECLLFLTDGDSGSETLACEAKRGVGHADEGAWSIVYAGPLHA